MSALMPPEDPAALRGAAAILRRDAEELRSSGRAVSVHAEGMVYAGPAADAFRTGVADANRQGHQMCCRFEELAACLERCANEVELEIMAARAAGGWS